MSYAPGRSTQFFPGHPVLRILASFPVACFCGAFATDAAYAASANVMWADFSDWLLLVGMATGLLAALAGIVAMFASRRLRPRHPALVAVLWLLVLALGLVDNLVHTRDGWTGVVPQGIVLSGLTALATLAAAWFGAAWMLREIVVVETPVVGVRP